ncbi:ComEC/Rec2 family competence protein [Romboutsia sp.]|uniref:ComEC/Rec2 family competence protein n=1 Tax=Romboutsia sp. TaxID=1965302 RepID=UPI003F2D37B5
MKKLKLFSLILIIISFLSGCGKNYLLSIHIIDVGQGDSILIQTASSKNILVDGGNEDSFHIIKSYLKKHKVKSLDLIIATHLDSDHIGSLDNIINTFNVKYLYTPEDTSNSESYENLLTSCENKNIPIKFLYKGDSLEIDKNTSLIVLSPSYIQEDSNLNSVVFKLDCINKSFLFTGDAEIPNESDIINSFDLEDIDFLKVGHHGSSSSTSEAFLNATTPDVAAISCGYKNQYGHPHRKVIDNLSRNKVLTYRTDLLGDIVFYCDGNTILTDKNYKSN